MGPLKSQKYSENEKYKMLIKVEILPHIASPSQSLAFNWPLCSGLEIFKNLIWV